MPKIGVDETQGCRARSVQKVNGRIQSCSDGRVKEAIDESRLYPACSEGQSPGGRMGSHSSSRWQAGAVGLMSGNWWQTLTAARTT